MVKKCYIAGCTSVDSGENAKLKLFPFPESATKRKLWLSRIAAAGGRTATKSPTESDCVCSLHFRSECFKKNKRGIELKGDVFPTERLSLLPKPLRFISALEDAPSDSYSCLVCNVKIEHMYELLKEVHIHRENRFLVCGHCRDIFDSYSKYMAHVTALGVTKPFLPSPNPRPAKDVPVKFQCAECCALFETTIARNVHISMTHNLNQTLEFVRREELEREKARRLQKGRRVKILAPDFEETEVRRSGRTRKRKVLADTNGKSARTKKWNFSARRKNRLGGRSISESTFKTKIDNLEKATKEAMEKLHNVMKQSTTKQKIRDYIQKGRHCTGNVINERTEEDNETKIEILTEEGTGEETVAEQENVTESHGLVHWYGSRTLRCGFCWGEFASLRHLDTHCSLKHPDQDAPLELMCEVDSSYDLKAEDFCKACLRKKLCLEMLQELLDDTDSVLKSSDTECINTKVAIIASSENSNDTVCSH